MSTWFIRLIDIFASWAYEISFGNYRIPFRAASVLGIGIYGGRWKSIGVENMLAFLIRRL